MYQDLEEIILELSSHDPSIDWDSMPSRIEAATIPFADYEITKHLKYIRGALLAYVISQGIENEPGFLLKIARTELLKLSWL